MDAYRNGARSVLAVSPTGSGKTTIFGHLSAQLERGGRRVLIVAHRRELIEQASNRLTEFDVRHGIIMAGIDAAPYHRVQVASIQTLVRRKAPAADLVIVDEAHLSTAATYRAILAEYPNARILGPTATPWRMSGKPLAGAYDACVVVATPRELREQGHLSDYVGFSYLTPDLSGVKTTAGEYNEAESARAMSDSLIVDNIVEQWQAHASALSTVVFAVTVEHSKQLTARFKAAGVTAEHLDGETPLEQRRAILRRVDAGHTRVLCNVGVAVEGLDIPRLKCCVLARPTKSLARAIQMMGRVRRPWVECPCGHEFVPKFQALACPACGGRAWRWVKARIHDHAFVIRQHGLPDADRDYSLNAKPEAPPSVACCRKCFANYPSGQTCPECGGESEAPPPGERVLQTVADAEQWGFDSGTSPDAVPEREVKPPVEVRWDNPSRKVEGRYVKTFEVERSHGPQRMYLIQGKRDYECPGTTRLNALMAKVQISDSVRIVHTHDTPLPGGKHRKEFTVERDDGT